MTEVSGTYPGGRAALTAVGRAATFVLFTAALVTATAAPARAHAGGGAEPSNHRVAVTSAPGAVTVEVGVGGQWVRVRLTEPAAGPVEVLGYRGEPFLRISAEGVRLNQRSTVARDNPRLAAGGQAGDEPDAGPEWTTVGRDRSVAWQDDRTSTGTGRWRLPLRAGGEPAAITGTRTYVDPPSPWPWIGGMLAVAGAVAAAGWRRRWHRTAVVALAAAVCASAAHLTGVALVPQPGPGYSPWLSMLFTGALCWPIAVVAVVLVLRRREHAPFAVAVAGAVFAVVSGPDDLAVLWHSQLPFAWPAAAERALVAVTVGVGVGLAVAGVRRLRRPAPVPTSGEPR